MRAVPGERTKILYNLATIFPTFLWFFFGVRKLACALTDSEQTPREEKRQQAKGPSGNKVYILLLAPRPARKARATSIPAAVCKERATQPAACGTQPGGARRRAGICGVAAPRRCHHIACVAAPCICPPGARAKMHTLFPDAPLLSESQFFASSCLRGGLGAAFTTKTRRHKESSRLTRPMQTV